MFHLFVFLHKDFSVLIFIVAVPLTWPTKSLLVAVVALAAGGQEKGKMSMGFSIKKKKKKKLAAAPIEASAPPIHHAVEWVSLFSRG